MFLDRGEIDRLQSFDLRIERFELLLPFERIGAARQRFEQGRHIVTGRRDRFFELLRAQLMSLMREAAFGVRFALLIQLLFDEMTLVLVAAEFRIAFFERLARFDELLVDEQALIEIRLTLRFQTGERIAALLELFGDVFLARLQLRELDVHAAERLFERGDRRTFRFQTERELMHLVGGFARVHARFFARFEQTAAFGIQMLTLLFLIAHARDGFFEPCARTARLFLIGGDPRFEIADFRFDFGEPRLRRFDLAAMALQLTGEFRRAAMRGVQIALRIVAHALGFSLARFEFFDVFAERFGARVGCIDLFAQRMDVALASEHARLRATATQHAREARAEPFARARDHRFVRRQRRGDALRVVDRIGGMNLAENPENRRWTLHVRRERSCAARIALVGGDQRDVGFANVGQIRGVRVRRIGEHAFEQTGQHRLDGRVPSFSHTERFAESARFIETEFRQPFAGRRFFLTERGVLQCFQR